MPKQQFLKELQLVFTKETAIIEGYIIPPVAVVVWVTNMLVILVYTKQYRQTKNKIRKISSILYISIAIANVLASLPTSIWYFYLFTICGVKNFIPYTLCWTWNFFIAYELFPHMASIIFVTLLSVQRYMVIRHPFMSIKIWTIRRTFTIVVIIWIVMFSLQIPHTLDTTFIPKLQVFNSTKNKTDETYGCSAYYANWLNGAGETMEIVWYMIKLIGVVCIPSTFIIYSDASLIVFLQESTDVRKTLVKTMPSKDYDDPESKDANHYKNDSITSEGRHQTLLVIILSSIVFVVEIPYAVLLVVYIHFIVIQDFDVIQWMWIGPAGNVASLTMHVSYPTIFILSCLFSSHFRKLMFNIFRSKRSKFRLTYKSTYSDNTISQDIQLNKNNSLRGTSV